LVSFLIHECLCCFLLRELWDATNEIYQGAENIIQPLQQQDGPSFDDRLEVYCKWANEVDRFSFRWHLRSETQTEQYSTTKTAYEYDSNSQAEPN
jgi:hypothetical protein